MLRKITLIAMALIAMAAGAQSDNGAFTVVVNDLIYTPRESSSPTTGEVIGTVLETLAGNATYNSHPESVPAVTAKVREAFTAVRRLAPVAEDGVFDISGEVTALSTTKSTRTVERKDRNGKPYNEVVNDYYATIAVTLTLTEVETGQQWTNNFTAGKNWLEAPENEAAAIQMSLARLQKEIIKCYNNMFPLVANIIERGKEKKDKIKEVYIDLGEATGITKGMHFSVFQIGEIGGKETRNNIGKLKVEEVLGDDISRCKVEKGNKEIKTALDEGQVLLITSID